MSMNVVDAGAAQGVHAMSGASPPMPPDQKMAGLFDQIDASGAGSIDKAQFEQAFQQLNPPKPFKDQGADAIWAKLDPGGTGTVSKQDFVSTMTGLMKSLRTGHHHHHAQDADAAGAAAPAPSPAATAAQGVQTIEQLLAPGGKLDQLA